MSKHRLVIPASQRRRVIRRRSIYFHRVTLAIGAGVVGGLLSPAGAQVVTDGTLGSARSLPGPHYLIGADLGIQRGGNLFHSFATLDIGAREVAQFTGPASVSRVVARVTGGSASNIQGTLQCSIPGASFYLINPAGVVFGPDAQLDIQGSFAVTTADFVRLGDGGRFDATHPTSSVLTTAAPSAFGFLPASAGATPKSISISGRLVSNGSGDPPVASTLQTPPGKVLSVVAGEVRIDTRALVAPGGRVNVLAVGGAGEILLNPEDPASPPPIPAPESGDIRSVGRIDLLGQAEINVDAPGGGGSILVQGGQVRLDGQSTIGAQTLDGAGGPVRISADVIELTNGSIITTESSGAGRGGDILLEARSSLTIDGGGTVSASANDAGAGGDIHITAPQITLDGGGDPIVFTSIAAQTSGAGRGGNIRLDTGSLHILNGAVISATTFGAGAAGTVTASAPGGEVVLDGKGFAGLTGLDASAQNDPDSGLSGTGPAGGVDVVAGRLLILGGAGIRGDSVGIGAGHGGAIRIVANQLTLDGSGTDASTGINANAGALVYDDAGNAHQLDGGPGGDISVNVAGTTRILAGAAIETDAFGAGRAGIIHLSTNRLLIDGAGGMLSTGIGALVEANASGHGGDVSIDADHVMVRNGTNMATIAVGTAGSGDAGSLTINAQTIRLQQRGSIESASGSLGDPDVAPGTGLGGDLVLTARRSMDISGHSAISAQADAADAGNVRVRVGEMVLLQDSSITTKAQGAGGNVQIDPQFIIMTNSQVLASAIEKQGGNIDMRADNFFELATSLIDASSRQSTPGQIDINAQLIDLTGGLAPLSAGLRDPTAQLQEACGLRLEGKISSFIVTGRGGVPPTPDGWQPALDLLDLRTHVP